MTMFRLAIAALALLLFVDVTVAQTVYTWNAGGYYWTTASNWNPGTGPPGSSDTAVFDPHAAPRFESSGTVASDVEVGSIRVGFSKGGGGRIVDGYGSITIGGTGSTGLTILNGVDLRFNPELKGASSTNQLQINIHNNAEFTATSVMNSNVGSLNLDGGKFYMSKYGNGGVDIPSLFSDSAQINAFGGLIDFDISTGVPNGNATETLGAFSVNSGNTRVNVRSANATGTISSVDFGAGSGRGTVEFTGDQGSGSPGNVLGGSTSNRRIILNGQATGNLPASVTVNRTNYGSNDATHGVQNASYTAVTNTISSAGNASNFHSLGQSATNATISSNFATKGLKIIPNDSGRTLDLTGTGNLNATGVLLVGSNDYEIRGQGTGAITGGGTRYFNVAEADKTLTISAKLAAPGNDFVKFGAGYVALTGDNSETLNSSVTRFIVNDGVLRSTVGTSGALPTNDHVSLDLRGGIFEISGGSNGTGAAADFILPLGDTSINGGRVSWRNGDADRGSGGFSAFGSDASINIGGHSSPTQLRWGDANFVQDGTSLKFGSTLSDQSLTWHNPLRLDADGQSLYSIREISVIRDGSKNSKAVLTGAISGTSNTDLLKSGNGILELAADSTIEGTIFVKAGRLRIGSGGSTGSIGASGGRIELGSDSVVEFKTSKTFLIDREIYGAYNTKVEFTGSGIATITSSQGLSAQVEISSGRVVVSGSSSAGLLREASVTGGTLDGTGSIADRVSISGSGALTAGRGGSASDRRLDIEKDLNFSQSSSFVVRLFGNADGNASRVHAANDVTILKNEYHSVTLGLELVGIDVDGFRAGGERQFVVLSTDKKINGSFATTDFTSAGFQSEEWFLSQGDDTITLIFTPIPEPATLLTIATIALGSGAVLRRWKRTSSVASTPPRADAAI